MITYPMFMYIEKAKHFLISSPHLVNTSGLSLQQKVLLNFFKILPPTIVPLRRRPDRSILFLRFFRGIRNGIKISSASSYAPSQIQADRSNWTYCFAAWPLPSTGTMCMETYYMFKDVDETKRRNFREAPDLTSSKNEKKKG